MLQAPTRVNVVTENQCATSSFSFPVPCAPTSASSCRTYPPSSSTSLTSVQASSCRSPSCRPSHPSCPTCVPSCLPCFSYHPPSSSPGLSSSRLCPFSSPSFSLA